MSANCCNLNLLKNKAYVGGKWVKACSNKEFPVMNPADDKVVGTVPDMDVVDTQRAIHAAVCAFRSWKHSIAKERCYFLRRWFNISQKYEKDIAEIITTECGKTWSESRTEVAYGNSFLEWFADVGRLNNGEIVTSPWPHKQCLVTRHPVGIVSVITPWNFPYAMITRKVGALLAAGCTCVVKPSEDTPLSALASVVLAEEAGIPEGLINVITTSRKNAPAVGKLLCQDNNIRCISFTGSTEVGKILCRNASTGVKKLALELGGNAPFIVFPSADIEHSIHQAMLAKFRNNGQACVGANRFYIHEDVYSKFIEGFKHKIKSECVMGPGMKKGVTCGPLINKMQVDKVTSLVDDAKSKGAKVLLGGKIKKELGSKFYERTLLVDVTPKMKIYSEEIFGPVAMCFRFKTEKEVLKLANGTNSGLAAYAFTKDLGQAFRMSNELEFGMVAINDGMLSAPETPFGGCKESGLGREGSMHGIQEYTELKYTLMSHLNR